MRDNAKESCMAYIEIKVDHLVLLKTTWLPGDSDQAQGRITRQKPKSTLWQWVRRWRKKLNPNEHLHLW